MNLQPIHLWLNDTEPSIRWEELEDADCAQQELILAIRERMMQCTQALTIFRETIDFSEAEAADLTDAVERRLNMFADMISARKCSKTRKPYCLALILQEGYARMNEAGRHLHWYKAHFEDCDDSTFDDVYETIVLFHELIHRYLRVSEQK